MSSKDGRSHWDEVRALMDVPNIRFGRHLTYWMRNSPRRLLHSMAYYKFASKLIGTHKKVLDIGCGEGIGTWLLAKECGFAEGVDFDEDALLIAKQNYVDERVRFCCENIFDRKKEAWSGIVNFDVIEHILPKNAGRFMRFICENLVDDGICVIGTPSLTSDQFANSITRAGHVNLYTGERLEEEMSKYFEHVFIFAANDEIIHTGFLPLAHYLLAVGCGPRQPQD